MERFESKLSVLDMLVEIHHHYASNTTGRSPISDASGAPLVFISPPWLHWAVTMTIASPLTC